MATLKRSSTTDRDISPPPTKRKVTTATTSKVVANFFKPASQKEPEKSIFTTVNDSLLVAHFGNANTIDRTRPFKIAAFDFDSTLIKTKSGNKFARGADDWTWWHASVPGRLKQLHEDGYAVMVLSNQGGISLKAPDAKSKTIKSDTKSLENFKGRVLAVANVLDFPISVYAATQKDMFRKPRTGMWERALRDYGISDDNALDLDHAGSIFVGDAAGREGNKAAGIAKDFSSSDRDLAANIGITFHTPEEFFLGEAPLPYTRTFQPTDHLTSTAFTPSITAAHPLEIILFCGSPGSGKSTFYQTHLAPLGYTRVNQDLLKTRDRCIRACRDALGHPDPAQRRSVVVDNTNADVATRAVWIDLARTHKIPVRLVLFTAPPKLCEHNDTVRALASDKILNPEDRTLLPKIAFTSFAARYQPPQLSEGLEEIIPVDFVFTGDATQRGIWSRYWIS
ncbi:PNK3P-domain-containing protein [Dissoconium aciculare CBS 342.82]|uniref:PNK3P-domain-containing protein n=1 Tax=Dissoconium aciculare CBS 342.82 TaxID=1314786 RepID=A0A6J3LYE0_9PEZI|nr:PNK3P-domain-containing protein [Dissoconium aciculare CBS 342.82]KAF1820324.1 PNK3P-domain-containing protein [Dissoconium aciculare CBS 342.82]